MKHNFLIYYALLKAISNYRLWKWKTKLVSDFPIIRLPTPYAACYLARGRDGYAIIDTDIPYSAEFILSALRIIDIRPKDIKAILLTHGHRDHAGSAEELRHATGAPIAIHFGDLGIIKNRQESIPQIIGGFSQIRRHFLKLFSAFLPFRPFDPDIDLRTNQNLDHFLNTPIRIIETPGHTSGSISFLMNSAHIFIGDLGKFRRGSFVPNHYLENEKLLEDSVQEIFSLGTLSVYPGHGNPGIIQKPNGHNVQSSLGQNNDIYT